MRAMNENEMQALLTIFKDFTTKYNAHSLSKELGLSAMGALKLLERLRQQRLLAVERIGNIKVYRMDDNEYARHYLAFLLRKEAEEAPARVKRWVNELRTLEHARVVLLFGSVLDSDKHNDVDLLALLEQGDATKFNEEVARMDDLNQKRIHAVKQTPADFERNLSSKDKVLLSAVRRGIVVFGHDDYVEALLRAR